MLRQIPDSCPLSWSVLDESLTDNRDFDRILLFLGGRVSEYNTPANLLSDGENGSESRNSARRREILPA